MSYQQASLDNISDIHGHEIAEKSKLSLYCPHTPSPRQREFLSLGVLEALYGGRAGCGKSDVLLMAALQGIAIPSYSALLIRRTYRELTKPGALLDRARSWFRNSPARWRDSEGCYEFPSGARIAFGYFDSDSDFAQYKSAEFQMIGIDESTELEPNHRQLLFGRLRSTLAFPEEMPLRFRDATNPGGPSHEFLRQRFGIGEDEEFPEGSPARYILTSEGDYRVFFPAHPKDNPGVNYKQYLRSLAELPPITRLQWEHGRWVQDSSGLCYPNITKVRRIPKLPEGHQWSFGLAVDVGATANCALAVWASAPDLPQSILVSTTEPFGLDTPTDLALEVKRHDSRYHFDWMCMDHGGLGKGYVNELRKWYQLPVMPVDKNDKPGHMRLFDGAMANGMIEIVEGACDSFEMEAKALLWKDDKRLEEKPGMRNHSCDAALYGWRKLGHYRHEPRDTSRDGMDDLELRLVAKRESDFRANRRNGMTLPGGYR